MTQSEPGIRHPIERLISLVQVFSKPNCVQCNMTYKVLDASGTEYNVTDITEDTEAYDFVTKELGYFQAPVVVAPDGTHWSGFRPDLINAL